MSLQKLNPNNQLFKQLASTPPKWWENLKKDKEIYIDVRKGNNLDV